MNIGNGSAVNLRVGGGADKALTLASRSSLMRLA
jgi:hypothetical protein